MNPNLRFGFLVCPKWRECVVQRANDFTSATFFFPGRFRVRERLVDIAQLGRRKLLVSYLLKNKCVTIFVCRPEPG